MTWIGSPIDLLPVVVNAGSILVTQKPGTSTEDSGQGGIEIHVFYGHGKSEFIGFEDDGISLESSENQQVNYKIRFDFDSAELSFEKISGALELKIESIYFWHFPEDWSKVRFQGIEHHLVATSFEWLEKLPNFDPFEDKGKTYFSDCRKIVIDF
jgi:alpha-glucosidase